RPARMQRPGIDEPARESRGRIPGIDRTDAARHMSSTLTAFRALVCKDIAIFLRDPRALVISVLTPIVVAGFFGFLFGGVGSGGNPISRMKVGGADLGNRRLTKGV